MTDLSDTSPVKEGDIVADKFRIEERLGIGGMGVVYAATHLQLGKRVALKLMLSNALGVPMAVARFEREARAMVQLRGDHVAQVLDVGKLANGIPYLVMELLDGHDLGTVVETSGPLPLEDAVDFVIQACEAVAEAHTRGIVHRDLKPRNLFLSRQFDGSLRIKVLDFGISKWAHGTEDHSLTRTSDVVGSPNYMSPEQIKNAKDVDSRTDIWSLGIVLYELLAGRVPFVATGVPQLCAMVLQDPAPSILELRAAIPPTLGEAIARCLEKEPDHRFQTVDELVRALEPHAPQRSRVPIDRVYALMSARAPSSLASSVAGPSDSRPSARVHVSNGTSVSWADTLFAGVSRKWIPTLMVGAVMVALAIAIFTGVSVASRHTGLVTSPSSVPASRESGPPSSVAPPLESAPRADATPAAPSNDAPVMKPPPLTKPTSVAVPRGHSHASGAATVDAGAARVVPQDDALTPGDRK